MWNIRLGGNRRFATAGRRATSPSVRCITSLPGVANTGNALASFLLGEVNAANIQISDKITTRAPYWRSIAQDDWRVTNRLTLNDGSRCDLELPRREVDNTMNSFDPLAINPVSGTPGVVTFAGLNGAPERAFATDKNNFGPRFGFAYQLPGIGRTVIRGGGGIFYGQTVSNTIGDTAALGFSTTASFVVAQADLQSVFRLRDGFPAVTRRALDAGFGAVPAESGRNTAVPFFNPKQVAPISYQYNLNLQREVERNSGGSRLHRQRQPSPDGQRLLPEPGAGASCMGAGDAQARGPFRSSAT